MSRFLVFPIGNYKGRLRRDFCKYKRWHYADKPVSGIEGLKYMKNHTPISEKRITRNRTLMSRKSLCIPVQQLSVGFEPSLILPFLAFVSHDEMQPVAYAEHTLVSHLKIPASLFFMLTIEKTQQEILKNRSKIQKRFWHLVFFADLLHQCVHT